MRHVRLWSNIFRPFRVNMMSGGWGMGARQDGCYLSIILKNNETGRVLLIYHTEKYKWMGVTYLSFFYNDAKNNAVCKKMVGWSVSFFNFLGIHNIFIFLSCRKGEILFLVIFVFLDYEKKCQIGVLENKSKNGRSSYASIKLPRRISAESLSISWFITLKILFSLIHFSFMTFTRSFQTMLYFQCLNLAVKGSKYEQL